MNNEVQQYVRNLLSDKRGHGVDHVIRVHRLASSFAKELNANAEIVELASWLHDVDDYKLFGDEHAKELINAKDILKRIDVNESVRTNVLSIIKNMGYSKYLNGIRPKTLEGMIVSDADMCDAIGSEGILRSYSFGESLQIPFFDKNQLPYTNMHYKRKNNHSVQHFFDKLLLIPTIMLTEPGSIEAKKRQMVQIEFLRELFREHNATVWLEYLEEFIIKHKLIGE